MKGAQKLILGLVAVAATFTAGSPAFADPWKNGDGRGRNDTYIYRNYDHQDHGRNIYSYPPDRGRTEVIKIYDNDRIILNRYVADRYRASYPPGWVKKHHGYPQMPRRYIIGYPLPRDVVYYSVPYEVRSHMRPVPVGYQYVRVDNDVLLMNAATKQIIDAVTLISAMGQR